MVKIAANRVRETTTTAGTGAVTLAGAVQAYQAFSAAVGTGNTCRYCISHRNAAEWEIGVGTYTASTLTRDSVEASSNAGALVSFSAGTKDVELVHSAAEDALRLATLRV